MYEMYKVNHNIRGFQKCTMPTGNYADFSAIHNKVRLLINSPNLSQRVNVSVCAPVYHVLCM